MKGPVLSEGEEGRNPPGAWLVESGEEGEGSESQRCSARTGKSESERERGKEKSPRCRQGEHSG